MDLEEKTKKLLSFQNKPMGFDITKYLEIEKGVYEFLELYLLERGELGLENKKIRDALAPETPIIDLAKLLPLDLELLSKIHILIHQDIRTFRDDARREIRRIRHTTSTKFVVSQNKIHGKIDWSKTFQERWARGFDDPTLFICRESSKNYDLPENLVLKKLIKKLEDITREAEVAKYIPQNDQKRYWVKELYTLKRVLDELEKNVYIDKITLMQKIPARMENKIRQARREFYRKTIFKAYKLYKDVLELKEITENIPKIKEILKETYITPTNLDELFEIFILFKTLKHFSAEEYRAIKKGKKNIASFAIRETHIKIYYNYLPDDFEGEEYKKIVQHYRLSSQATSRRPDIIVEFDKEGTKDYIIIEVKFTDHLDYITDSIYKVLGYIKDFEKKLGFEKEHAVLAVWDYEEKEKRFDISERELLVQIYKHSNYEEKIIDLIKKIEIGEKKVYV